MRTTPTTSADSAPTLEAAQECKETTKPEYVARKKAMYVTTREGFEDAWGEFYVENMDFAGLDCEFMGVLVGEPPSLVRKVALLQLTGPRCTLLYHIARMDGECREPSMFGHISLFSDKTLPHQLVEWLQDDSVQKSGVNVTSKSQSALLGERLLEHIHRRCRPSKPRLQYRREVCGGARASQQAAV